MTLNYQDDGTILLGRSLDALLNAHGAEAVISGCGLSAGTGDWDIDVASGTAFLTGSGEVSVSAQTVTVTQPSNDTDMGSGDSRVDLVTVNSSGSANVTEGTAASTPNAPQIPSGEAFLGWALIRNSDGSLSGSDIHTRRVLLNDDGARYHDGGAHEIDAASFTGASGSSGQFLASDGAAASWSKITGEFATESGSFSASGDTEHVETTVSLSNDYAAIAASAYLDADINSSGPQEAGVKSTDATNDQITVEHANQSSTSKTVQWTAFGVLA